MTYYSTEEHIVSNWIDKKPVYERTYYIYLVERVRDTILVDNFLTDNSIDTLIKLDGIANYIPSETVGPDWIIPHDTNTTTDMLRFWVSRNRIYCRFGSTWPAFPCKVYVTVRYTKTTD